MGLAWSEGKGRGRARHRELPPSPWSCLRFRANPSGPRTNKAEGLASVNRNFTSAPLRAAFSATRVRPDALDQDRGHDRAGFEGAGRARAHRGGRDGRRPAELRPRQRRRARRDLLEDPRGRREGRAGGGGPRRPARAQAAPGPGGRRGDRAGPGRRRRADPGPERGHRGAPAGGLEGARRAGGRGRHLLPGRRSGAPAGQGRQRRRREHRGRGGGQRGLPAGNQPAQPHGLAAGRLRGRPGAGRRGPGHGPGLPGAVVRAPP